MTQWMNLQQAFEILEIEPTSDRKVIKRAYAQMVKKYHPEEYPEEWQRVHDAYEYALDCAGRNMTITKEYSENREEQAQKGETQSKFQYEQPSGKFTPSINDLKSNIPEPETIIIPQFTKEEEAEIDFNNIENIARQNWEKDKKEQEKFLPYVMDLLLLQSNRKIQKTKQWEELLAMHEVQKVRLNATFLYRLGDCLNWVHINKKSYVVIMSFLEKVYNQLSDSVIDEAIKDEYMEALKMATQGAIKAWKGKGPREKGTWKISNRDTEKFFQNAKKLKGWVYLHKGIILFLAILVLKVATRYEKYQITQERNDTYNQERVTNIQQVIDEQEQKKKEEEAIALTIQTAEDTILQVVLNENHVPAKGKESVYDEISKRGRLNIWGMYLPEQFKTLTGAEEEDAVACFIVRRSFVEQPEVNVFLYIEEFGLESGQYVVWQHDGEAYCAHEVSVQEEIEAESYPYEQDGKLYIRTQTYEDIGVNVDVYPVIIMKKGTEE